MSNTQKSTDKPRPRVLMIAHSFDADFSMESRLSWMRATKAAEQFDTTVICAEPFGDVHCDVHAQVPGLRIVTVAHTEFEKLLIGTPWGFYLAYRLWHWRVKQVAMRMHKRQPFSLVHQVSYCGYREPGYCWQLDVPFVWGPVGGTQNVSWRFLSQLDGIAAVKEACRSAANLVQLRFGSHVGKALRAAKAVYVANQQVSESFRAAHGVDLPVQLETGLDTIVRQPQPRRDRQRPLRVLWAGRLESWKALPLLLKAIAKVPAETPVELRVLGSGSQEKRWKRLAERLGISNQIDWIALPEYSDRDEHYEWADVLAFTSLRDTSGTGLLEALGAGVPILGLDHQGARDIMSAECAVRVAVESPQQVVADFSTGLVQLARDPARVHQLSVGAVERAKNYHWDCLTDEMLACYRHVLETAEPELSDKTLDSSSLSTSEMVKAASVTL